MVRDLKLQGQDSWYFCFGIFLGRVWSYSVTVIGQVRGALNPVGLPSSGLSPAEDDTAHALCSKESN